MKTKTRRDFESWMKDVNRYCGQLCGLSADDLPDCCYADWHEDGVSALAAARRAIRAAKSDGDY